MLLAPQDLLIEPPLRIRYLPGSGTRLVVSISGVGNKRHEEPPLEFSSIAHGLEANAEQGENHVLFVTDESRSWMNGPRMAEMVCSCVAETAARIGASRIVAIGNSMGGSSALILAALMPIDAVVAVAPQYSVHPDVIPEETRWRFFRNRITAWPHRQVPDIGAELGDVIVMNGDSPDELAHALRFAPMETHFIFPGQDHRLASRLHAHGKLAPILTNAIQGRPDRARSALQSAGGLLRAQWARQNPTLAHPAEEMTT